ncbi:hypothetical protein BJ878DRAFT_560625 [Calycina marina]|uniref:SprT-like domain-containing protein n=1 Tax=Calycina marina TaxID=1763456 RepID=A0A9P8CGN1_9HELO|nr:hypothetical protein BJ878DRAFT_560625 [Calycina marina]
MHRRYSGGHGGGRSHLDPANEFKNLRPGSYRAEDLVRILTDNAAIPLKKKLPKTSAEWVIRCHTMEAIPTDTKFLDTYAKRWLAVFGHGYYFDALEKDGDEETFKGIEVIDPKHPVLLDPSTGKYMTHRGFFHPLDRKIYVVNGDFGREDKMLKILGTILHEALHAFLNTFVCDKKCCEDFLASTQGLGLEGHATQWSNAMFELEKAVKRDLGLKINTGFHNSIGAEMMQGFNPEDDDLDRWRVPDKIINFARERKTQGEREYRRMAIERRRATREMVAGRYSIELAYQWKFGH